MVNIMKEVWISVNAFARLPIFNDTTRVMHMLLLLAVKEGNIYKVYLNANIREQILEGGNIPKSSYCRAIKELENCSFLTKDRDVLIINLPKGFRLPIIYQESKDK